MSDVEVAAFTLSLTGLRDAAGSRSRASRALASILSDAAVDVSLERDRRRRLASRFAEVEANALGVTVVGLEGPQ